ncbi:E3 ubiquitin-protein ligase rnft1 [Clonorchis sinensis]|uniref:E3 ubiquitin-protein ligase rnft1 n=2 Tax=Clonorchis sinensis TaxID=79923 RepID=A0A419Q8X4_CLOSI|nr:E3 ubiquitin-protein ligase rnft1 [Clonorchis sinensis]
MSAMAFIVHVSDDTADHCALSNTSKNESMNLRILLHIAFIILLATRLYFEHFLEILLLLWLFASTLYVHKSIRQDVFSRCHDERVYDCLLSSSVATFYLLFLHFSLGDRGLYRIFLFLPPYSPMDDLWFVFWTCALVDGTVKIVSSLCKSLFVTIPSRNLSTYRLGTVLVTLECCSLVIRNTYPCFVWVLFFTEINGSHQSPLFQKILLTAFYCALKIGSFVCCLRSLKQVWQSLFAPPPFKVEPLVTQRCILCRGDYTLAGVLRCNHSVCESCVQTWCSRHAFCPTCNVTFSHQTQWRDGSMDLFIQLY